MELLYAGLSHKILIKAIYVFGQNVTEYLKNN